MPYVRDSFWRGRKWDTLEQIQTAALEWCTNVAGQRHHRSLGGASPYTVFLAAEADMLLALPSEPFELASWATPKVGVDCHVSVAGVLYSVPWRLIGQRVDVRSTARRVEVFTDGTLVKTHTRATTGRQTDYADYPPDKVAFFMRTPVWCRTQATGLGPHVAAVVHGLLEHNALHRLRSAQGILGLADKHGAERVDAACRRATEVGDPSYRTIKGILAAGTEADPAAIPVAATVPAHLHGAQRLFDNEVAS
jgi:hypothetical protein